MLNPLPRNNKKNIEKYNKQLKGKHIRQKKTDPKTSPSPCQSCAAGQLATCDLLPEAHDARHGRREDAESRVDQLRNVAAFRLRSEENGKDGDMPRFLDLIYIMFYI